MNTGLITRYTGALYNAPEHCHPRYDEFRDMFSEGQLKSKLWLVQELSKLLPLSNKKIAIAGSWFATLAFLFLEDPNNKNLTLTCIDVDKRCEEFIKYLAKLPETESVKAVTQDMFLYSYTEDIVINTSCEHLLNLNEWLEKISSNSIVVLQSNDFTSHPSHVNCVKSLSQFKNQVISNFSEILYEGEQNFGVYTRYLVIGKKK